MSALHLAMINCGAEGRMARVSFSRLVEDAVGRLAGVAERTPVQRNPRLSAITGAETRRLISASTSS